ncbi:hypothetical protein LOAG_05203 [Loa loa]|uniref:Uncharacterized protein n=1 Tax=Loa loa TaxID=7209 RepID=A0A1S0U0S6_LOALO|nr:hypothetical protein LOAG_05203 [Loa loa]EFO23279.1 hypothetical protein LOAG_05203 [Loa loa]
MITTENSSTAKPNDVGRQSAPPRYNNEGPEGINCQINFELRFFFEGSISCVLVAALKIITNLLRKGSTIKENRINQVQSKIGAVNEDIQRIMKYVRNTE